MMVIGVDEAGRGPLAGPVYAAAVVLPSEHRIDGLKDSKLLSAKKRLFLAEQIKAQAMAWGIGFSTVHEIDELNILGATFLSMSRAVRACLDHAKSNQAQLRYVKSEQAECSQASHSPDQLGEADTLLSAMLLGLRVKVDGNLSPGKFDGPWDWPYDTETIVAGDSLVAEISAASILAKVSRDSEMQKLHDAYPQYGFIRHAGYGTAEHLQALRLHGPCPAHRRSFAPVRKLLNSQPQRSGDGL